MLRLRCYVFGNLVREAEIRELTREELTFLENHRTECESCRHREANNQCRLEAVKSHETEEEIEEVRPTRSILDNLGFRVN